MKVFCLAPREDWICDRIASEWNNFCQDISSSNLENADVIWLLAGWCWKYIPEIYLKEKKVVVSVHHIVPNKMTHDKIIDFQNRDLYVDSYHVPNIKTHDELRLLTNKRIEVIPYWFDEKKWYYSNKIEAQIRMGLFNEKFKIGSFQRDTEGFDNLTPKLEKGPDIFCDLLGMHKSVIKDDIQVILAGWRRGYVKNRLSNMSINFSEFEKVELDILRSLYACLDLYIVSSRFEGGPQAILEAAAMKIPVISTDVGIANTILNRRCILNMPNEFILPNSDDIEYAFEKVQFHRLDLMGKIYISFFKDVLDD
jgi:glycosyltransferase involved in cell wall biosynthesis